MSLSVPAALYASSSSLPGGGGAALLSNNANNPSCRVSTGPHRQPVLLREMLNDVTATADVMMTATMTTPENVQEVEELMLPSTSRRVDDD